MFTYKRAELKSSVKDLAVKCKELKTNKNCLRDRKRAGEAHPTIEWNDGTRVDFHAIVDKLHARRYCSRYHHLVYGFARDKAYRKMERACNVSVSATELAIILIDFIEFIDPEIKAQLEKSRYTFLDSHELGTPSGWAPQACG